ncbi:hypothetical protein PMAYCL1PPCAC_07827 [Pristionchus mayeri]|uniref:NADAR domain-containing protein n=1 Tax=Pristionchus mayeri TaxID=1317129 RepID=A0AAN4ZGS8_9BILA|nr:hypothetical protein PMAYCL1PPCAC_07827 [Pristionchus mayeri]
MSYFGSFSNSAFARDEPRPLDSRAATEPYGSARYAMTDSTWALNQTGNIWATQPQPRYQQHFEQPRYSQVFEQQSLSSRPMNPMQSLTSQPMYSSLMSGGSSYGALRPLSSSFNGRNDRYDDRRDRRDGGRRDDRQWMPQEDRRFGGRDGYRNDNRNGGGRNNYNNNRNGGGDRRQNDRRKSGGDNAPRRVNEGASPKQKKGDSVPSRIAPAASSTPMKDRPRDGNRPFGGRDGGPRRNNQNGKPPMKRRNNKSTDLEFKSIPDAVESKSFLVKGENLVCFQGLQSVLTTQHEFPIVMDGCVYSSVDHYYQIEKCKQLTGKDCEELLATVQDEDKFTITKSKSGSKTYGQLAREFLKENKIDRSDIEEWRREGGVIATYNAMRAKAQQCSEMRDFLNTSINKIIVHTYAGDAIFGSGTRVQFVHKWADDMAKTNSKIEISMVPLLDKEAIAMAPQIAQGRNILGLIHMQLAEEINKGDLPYVITAASLEVDGASSSSNPIDISGVDISQEQEDELMKEE